MAQREIPQLYSSEQTPRRRLQWRINLGWSIGLSLLLSLLLSLFVGGLSASAQGEGDGAAATPSEEASPQELVNVVFDGADLFSPEEVESLNSWARELLEQYGVAMAVEVVPTINGRSIEQWTTDRANERGVGSAELNNGLFYGIALDDREFYVAKGDGYASISDSTLESILDSEMIPRFKAGDFAGGIIASSQKFGARAIGEEAAPYTGSSNPSLAAESMAIAGSIFGWTLGAIGVGFLGYGSYKVTNRVITKRREKEEAERRAEETRLAQATKVKRNAALGKISKAQWEDFALISAAIDRRAWLLSNNVYSDAFDLPWSTDPSYDQIELIDRDLEEVYFGGIPFIDGKNFAESREVYLKEQERLRERARIAAEERRRDDAVRRDAQAFWKGLSKSEKQEYARIRDEDSQRRWVSDHGGSGIFGINPTIALAMLVVLTSEHTRAELAAQRAAEQRETDYRSSSSTDYNSSNMFGGGSFGGGGGSGGSW